MTNEPAGKQAEQQRIRPRASVMARLFSWVIGLIAVGWGCRFVFIWRIFGLNPAIADSFYWSLLIGVCLLMRFRWKYLGAGDWSFFVILLPVIALGDGAFVQHLYGNGWHYRPGQWTFSRPLSEEDRAWDRFERAFRQEPGFRFVTKRRSRDVNWLEGKLDSMADLDRLIALAKKCGIKDEHLDGPYQKSISITIPGTDRSKPQ